MGWEMSYRGKGGGPWGAGERLGWGGETDRQTGGGKGNLPAGVRRREGNFAGVLLGGRAAQGFLYH